MKTAYPGIYKRQSKLHGPVFDVVANADGRQQWRRGFSTLTEARRALDLMKVELRKGKSRTAEPETHKTAKHRTHLAERVVERGWKPGTDGENRICLALSELGFLPRMIEQEFRLGPYRLDFALPLERVALEADGLIHTTPRRTASDLLRDQALRAWGWQVFRFPMDDLTDSALFAELTAVVLKVVPDRLVRA